jgi:DNA-directed RNA polymerase subunit K/omega
MDDRIIETDETTNDGNNLNLLHKAIITKNKMARNRANKMNAGCHRPTDDEENKEVIIPRRRMPDGILIVKNSMEKDDNDSETSTPAINDKNLRYRDVNTDNRVSNKKLNFFNINCKRGGNNVMDDKLLTNKKSKNKNNDYYNDEDSDDEINDNNEDEESGGNNVMDDKLLTNNKSKNKNNDYYNDEDSDDEINDNNEVEESGNEVLNNKKKHSITMHHTPVLRKNRDIDDNVIDSDDVSPSTSEDVTNSSRSSYIGYLEENGQVITNDDLQKQVEVMVKNHLWGNYKLPDAVDYEYNSPFCNKLLMRFNVEVKRMNRRGQEMWHRVMPMVKGEYQITRSTVTQAMKVHFKGML